MASHWKSTPTHWCKFCETYVRDTPIERRNHDSTAKHQNNIQRQLRNLHKDQEKQKRDAQRAKDEVARLNGLVGGGGGKPAAAGGAEAFSRPGAKAPEPAGPKLSGAAQRKAHAEQLAVMGVALPEELKREVTGVGGWQVTAERVVPKERASGRTLADIKQQEEDREAGKLSKGVHKRKLEDDEDVRDEEAAPKRKVWGSTFKKFPGNGSENEVAGEDLDALLSGVVKKKDEKKPKAEIGERTQIEEAKAEEGSKIRPEPSNTDAQWTPAEDVKTEENGSGITAPPTVVFKKRKGAKK